MDAIGLCETTSIAIGHQAEDEMLKAAEVQLLLARSICPGKYLVVVGGEVSSVRAAVDAGAQTASHSLVENRVIARVHEKVFPAISCAVELEAKDVKALGIVETFSASSIIDCADAAVKASEVVLFRVHLAMAVGGKGFFMVTGEVAAVEAAIAAGAQMAAEEGILVGQVVIPGPRPELFREVI
jgi:microcompartment protein CcmL/EutN